MFNLFRRPKPAPPAPKPLPAAALPPLLLGPPVVRATSLVPSRHAAGAWDLTLLTVEGVMFQFVVPQKVADRIGDVIVSRWVRQQQFAR